MKVTTSWLDHQPQEKIDAALVKFRRNPRYQRYLDDYNGDERFALFMALVDRRLLGMVGLTAMDMADFPSWDCYESGMSPADAAMECLYEQDGFDMFFGGE